MELHDIVLHSRSHETSWMFIDLSSSSVLLGENWKLFDMERERERAKTSPSWKKSHYWLGFMQTWGSVSLPWTDYIWPVFLRSDWFRLSILKRDDRSGGRSHRHVSIRCRNRFTVSSVARNYYRRLYWVKAVRYRVIRNTRYGTEFLRPKRIL